MINDHEPILTLEPETTVFTRVYLDEALTLAHPLGYCIAVNICAAYSIAGNEAAFFPARDTVIIHEHDEQHRDLIFNFAAIERGTAEIRQKIDDMLSQGGISNRVHTWYKLAHHLNVLAAVGGREALLPASHRLQFARNLWRAGADDKMLRYGTDGPQMKNACIRVMNAGNDIAILTAAEITCTNNSRVFESTVRPVLQYLTANKIPAFYDAGVPA